MVIVACGTSYHAGLIGRYAIEKWSRVPVEMDVASEFRYRDPVIDARDLVIGISQSGETADTLAAMRLAREKGAKVLAVTNIMGSQATRDADGVLFTRAGLEIGVAATKTFVAQVAAMYLFALKLAKVHDTLEPEAFGRLVADLKRHAAPHRAAAGRRSTSRCGPWPSTGRDAEFFLYLGRHVGLAVALEGALKLKEISYVPTDAYAAGEMKHGPIALLDEDTPVVCVATDSPVLDKVLSNISEVRARGAHVLAVATEGNDRRGRPRRGGRVRAAHRLAAAAAAGRDPAAAAGLPHRPRARPERGPAAQPRQDGHGGVTAGRAVTVGMDLLDIGRLERSLERRPRLASDSSPTTSGPTRPTGAVPAQPPGGALLRQGGRGQGARAGRLELPRRGGGGHRRCARACACGEPPRVGPDRWA